jgi:hypothetical protein
VLYLTVAIVRGELSRLCLVWQSQHEVTSVVIFSACGSHSELSNLRESARVILGDVRRGCTFSGGTAVRAELCYGPLCLCPVGPLWGV